MRRFAERELLSLTTTVARLVGRVQARGVFVLGVWSVTERMCASDVLLVAG